MQPTVPQSAGAADMDLPAVQPMDWLFKKDRIYLLAQFWQQVNFDTIPRFPPHCMHFCYDPSDPAIYGCTFPSFCKFFSSSICFRFNFCAFCVWSVRKSKAMCGVCYLAAHSNERNEIECWSKKIAYNSTYCTADHCDLCCFCASEIQNSIKKYLDQDLILFVSIENAHAIEAKCPNMHPKGKIMALDWLYTVWTRWMCSEVDRNWWKIDGKHWAFWEFSAFLLFLTNKKNCVSELNSASIWPRMAKVSEAERRTKINCGQSIDFDMAGPRFFMYAAILCLCILESRFICSFRCSSVQVCVCVYYFVQQRANNTCNGCILYRQ